MVIWERRYFTFRNPGDLPRRRSSADLSRLPFCGHQYQLNANEHSAYAPPSDQVDITTVRRDPGLNSAKAMTSLAIAITLTNVANKTVEWTLTSSSPINRYSSGWRERVYFFSSASNSFSALATAVPQGSLSEKNLSLSPLARIVIPPVATAAPP